jgi:hypothetical protein
METLYDKTLNMEVEYARQLILLFGAGILLVLGFFLSYLPRKRPRDPRTYQIEGIPRHRGWGANWSYMPWILVLTYVGIFLYSIIQAVRGALVPPNY